MVYSSGLVLCASSSRLLLTLYNCLTAFLFHLFSAQFYTQFHILLLSLHRLSESLLNLVAELRFRGIWIGSIPLFPLQRLFHYFDYIAFNPLPYCVSILYPYCIQNSLLFGIHINSFCKWYLCFKFVAIQANCPRLSYALSWGYLSGRFLAQICLLRV